MMIDTRHHSSVQHQTDGKTILVVEDNEDVGTFLVLMLLTESPYQALLVTDGFQALKMVHDLKPSLFLVDYQLPGMDGIALYDRLHAITDLADIPAIIMSANLPTQALQERHLTGVAKPFDVDQLLHTIEQLLA
jgi:CheY-like chemotaxis protein